MFRTNVPPHFQCWILPPLNFTSILDIFVWKFVNRLHDIKTHKNTTYQLKAQNIFSDVKSGYINRPLAGRDILSELQTASFNKPQIK